MPIQKFSGGRIQQADYDPSTQHLELLWDNKTILAYKQVPQEVFRRLCAAPNAATYWEDRIAEEYPKAAPRKTRTATDSARSFDSLFGGED